MNATASRTRAQTKVEAKALASGPPTAARWASLRPCRASKPLAPPVCAAATPANWLVISEARMTERIAVPIEAPDWRMMFIAVEVRAIAAGGTDCIAAVIVGIIERPMPRPRTKPKPQSST